MAALRFSFSVSFWRFRLRAISVSLSRMVGILLSRGMIGTAQTAHYSEDGSVCQYVRLDRWPKPAGLAGGTSERSKVFDRRLFLAFL
jgi:hypothetical protein